MASTTHADLVRVRTSSPGAVAVAARKRWKRPLGDDRRMLILTVDYPARGALAAHGDSLAMADRPELLRRLCTALERPGVGGIVATADILEDLLLLGALDDKLVFGSMNHGGLAGSAFELDERFTGYRAEDLRRARFDGGRLLLPLDMDDPRTPNTMSAVAEAINALSERRLTALVEPFVSRRVGGAVRLDLSPDALIRSMAVASGLGGTSAYTWLKVPVVEDLDDIDRVLAATTLPLVVLGDERPGDAETTRRRWRRVLRGPHVRGLVLGRTLLYPPDGQVAAAVDAVVDLL